MEMGRWLSPHCPIAHATSVAEAGGEEVGVSAGTVVSRTS